MSMTDNQKEFLKYINGIKYLLFDRKSTVKAEDIMIPNKIKDLCEKYLLPVNMPITTPGNSLMVIQNDPDIPKYKYYVRFNEVMTNTIKKIGLKHLTDSEETAFIKAVHDELLNNSIPSAVPSEDMLPMLNGYFDRTKSIFVQDEVPEFATGFADTSYIDFSDSDSNKLEVYNIMKTLMEDNPSIAEVLFHALAKEANQSHTIIGQFYAAICDGQPYAPCKGCHANKKTDCALCSRNRIIRDMYKA